MKRCNKLSHVAAALAAGVMMMACDEIAPDDRFIHMDEIIPQRAALLVDFTGQYCINCPGAHEVIEQLEHQYGDSLIAVSVHCGDFGRSYTLSNLKLNRIWLMYEEGDRIDEQYNQLGSWPAGIVDMKGGALLDAAWPSAVRSALTVPPRATVSLKAEISGTTVTLTAEIATSSNGDLKFAAWLLEDGITAPQMNAEGKLIPDYVHNNVFRRSFTDPLGDKLTVVPDNVTKLTYTVGIEESDQEHFDHSRLKVVGFVQDASGVLEAARVNVIQH